MKKRLIPLVALVLSSSAMAQVGIGTKKAANSSQLEIVALDKGVLLPRVMLEKITDQSPIKGEMVESLLVYHIGSPTLHAGFYYWKSNAWNELLSSDTFVDRKNTTFTIAPNPDKNNEESLVITDSENHSVYLAIADIAKNSTFITHLVDNQEFISKLGDNIDFINHITNNNEFIEQIINNLKGKYGNVNYNATTNKFVYYDEQGVEHEIDWSSINTTNVSFTLDQDFLVVTDSAGNAVRLAVEEIAKNSTFITHLVENQEFITKLGDNIDFINQITNNNEFIEQIINNLKGKYGNVNYNATTNKFVYYDEQGVEHEIDWSSINTTNVSFTLDQDFLVVTDSAGNAVRLAVEEIAKNSKFVTELVENQEFITKLGNKVEFIEQITNNNEFIEQIINNLKGKYGNVNYNATTNKFVYYDEQGVEHEIDWSSINTTNVSFTLDQDFLVVTDSAGNAVRLAVEEIAKNSKFVTNLVENQEFITKLGDNIDFIKHITENNEFITNIIEELKGTYGNVGYDTVNNNFFYYDENKQPVVISWDVLGNTKIKSFEVDEVNDVLVITDTENTRFTVAIDDLGKIIANNDVFVTELVDNQEFITKLGNKVEFIEQITNNNEFITNIIEELKGTYGNVGYDTVNNTFFYYDENKQPVVISWDALGNTKIKSFEVDEVNDVLVITDTENTRFTVAISDLGKIIANNDVFVTELVDNQEFITQLGNKIRIDVAKISNGKNLLAADSSIVVDGLNSMLKETSIKVGTEAITTSHIKNGTILPEDLSTSPRANQVLLTDANNVPNWSDLSALPVSSWMVQGTTNAATLNTENIFQTGTVAIGTNMIPTTESTAKLYVAGDVVTSGKYFTTNSVYADYVFEKYFTGSSDIKLTYEFNSLTDVANFVKEYHHLPGVTPITELSKSDQGYGFDLTNLSVELLEKVEELFLHTIEQQDQIEKLNKEQEHSNQLLEDTRKRLEVLERLMEKSINNSK